MHMESVIIACVESLCSRLRTYGPLTELKGELAFIAFLPGIALKKWTSTGGGGRCLKKAVRGAWLSHLCTVEWKECSGLSPGLSTAVLYLLSEPAASPFQGGWCNHSEIVAVKMFRMLPMLEVLVLYSFFHKEEGDKRIRHKGHRLKFRLQSIVVHLVMMVIPFL